MTTARAQDQDHWEDDLLGRREWAQRLYEVLIARHSTYHCSPDADGLCAAIDGEWGVGKTFFVHRLQKDVEKRGHIALRFDAWANDLSEDPLIGFIAELQEGLLPYIKKLHPSPATRKAKLKLRALAKGARQAIVPAAAVLAKGALNTFSRGAADELLQIIDEAYSPEEPIDQKTVLKDIGKASSKAAETFFDNSLKAHKEKQAGIASFKKELEELLVALDAAKAPMFIFVDELDRCRPTYSIKLLESIKHVFNVPGVCFVLSTNLRQLSSSIKSVYGQEFDGYRYLKKFVSFEYALPLPEYESLAAALAVQSIIRTRIDDGSIIWHSGHPSLKIQRGSATSEAIAVPLVMVARGMQLDARSQRQIFQHAEIAISMLAEGTHVVGVYLFFICAIQHIDASNMCGLLDKGDVPLGTLKDSLQISPLTYPIRKRHTSDKSEITLREIILKYLKWAAMSGRRLNDYIESDRNEVSSWDIEVLNDTYHDGSADRPTLAGLPRLVRYAQQFNS